MVRACYPGGSLVGPEVRCSAPFRTRVHCIRRCGRLAAFDSIGAGVEEQIGKTVWQGRIGDAPLRVDMLPSGRIAATWTIRGNERRAVVDTIEQLQSRVLFQLMLGAGPEQDAVATAVARAIAEAQVDLPDPTQAPPRPRKKRPARRPGPPRSRRRR